MIRRVWTPKAKDQETQIHPGIWGGSQVISFRANFAAIPAIRSGASLAPPRAAVDPQPVSWARASVPLQRPAELRTTLFRRAAQLVTDRQVLWRTDSLRSGICMYLFTSILAISSGRQFDLTVLDLEYSERQREIYSFQSHFAERTHGFYIYLYRIPVTPNYINIYIYIYLFISATPKSGRPERKNMGPKNDS